MKFRYTFIAAFCTVVALAVSSCGGSKTNQDSGPDSDLNGTKTVKVTFDAVGQSNLDASESGGKATADFSSGDMEIVWSKGDEIFVVISNAEGERMFCPFKATEDGKSVTFEGEYPEGEWTESETAVYIPPKDGLEVSGWMDHGKAGASVTELASPYGYTYKLGGGTDFGLQVEFQDVEAFPSEDVSYESYGDITAKALLYIPIIGKLQDGVYHFHISTSMIIMEYRKLPANARKISFRCGDTQITGAIDVLGGSVVQTAAKEERDAIRSGSFTLEKDGGSILYYIPVPFGTVNGFELWLTDADGNELDHKTATRSVSFEQNKMYKFVATYKPKTE